ncbi:TRAM domain-containing protein [Haladaptatus halobius]|uniref:TRAM domain-containing protein n=1 Tax=Haladaptatus halobius TaxID=2884875 RepID=UPI001D0A5649|nr:TRAM domain-containing protein [Haladaptatus halobius]
MVEIPENLQCLYSGTVTRSDDEYVIEIPAAEIKTGTILPGETVRVATCPQRDATTPTSCQASHPEPPVSEGEQRNVTIEDIGAEGDGIAYLDRGYVLFVPETEPSETVDVEIDRVMQRFAVASVLDDKE